MKNLSASSKVLLAVTLIVLLLLTVNAQPVQAGNNGQQVAINFCYATSFTISGSNQNPYSQATYTSTAADPYGCTVQYVQDWWWVGTITVTATFADGATETQYFDVPAYGNDWAALDFKRNAAVERGYRWLTVNPDYSMSAYVNIENSRSTGTKDIVTAPTVGYYRTDCSGFVSYAWGLPGLIQPDGVALHYGKANSDGTTTFYSTPLNFYDLMPGDIVVNPLPGASGHVILFAAWVDRSNNIFLGYDQYKWVENDVVKGQGARVQKYQFSTSNGIEGYLSYYYGPNQTYSTGSDVWYADRKR
jgi:cell wall-associated NlpC family hydrolase